MKNWTIHACIPTVHYTDSSIGLEGIQTCTTELLESVGIPHTITSKQAICLFKSDMLPHFKKKTNAGDIYGINISLVSNVIGSDHDKQTGYMLEILAHGFKDNGVRRTLITKGKDLYFNTTTNSEKEDAVARRFYKRLIKKNSREVGINRD